MVKVPAGTRICSMAWRPVPADAVARAPGTERSGSSCSRLGVPQPQPHPLVAGVSVVILQSLHHQSGAADGPGPACHCVDGPRAPRSHPSEHLALDRQPEACELAGRCVVHSHRLGEEPCHPQLGLVVDQRRELLRVLLEVEQGVPCRQGFIRPPTASTRIVRRPLVKVNGPAGVQSVSSTGLQSERMWAGMHGMDPA